jgi:hypothetical protein
MEKFNRYAGFGDGKMKYGPANEINQCRGLKVHVELTEARWAGYRLSQWQCLT